ncbi:glyoxylate/hydroxypyruvate reductase A [Ancylobacter sp. 6x-1]|uniref:Glyoxylate/hydroxypyruvate reductase A n=1 Tax=Ancylobacter crimeensis TaxID=2579147 RepID=A0ABT0DBF0_9HYPH|nr:glyoxylate/hydroxypyruvate reductase A [Ancylobacter crimeensis]MCK0197290.1 glyoxylate/hydroxypyruvate reductase A [Ancylobacter crimeensis]
MSKEALVFYSAVDDPAAWREALTAELPELDFRVAPEIGDPSEVSYALVWSPPAGFFAGFPNLKLVTNLGAGVDALVRRDDLVPVPISRLNDPGMVQMMASYIIFAVTRYARDIPVFEEAQRRGEWTYVHPRALSEIRVGVLGLGELGGPAAAALARMGFTVSGWSRSAKRIEGVTSFTGRDGLEHILSDSEIVVVLVPLTRDSEGLIGAAELALMKKGAKLVNASRGRLVDEPALIAALASGHLGGATLDVFVEEPLPASHTLWTTPNVLITPHIASITVPSGAARDVAESIRRVRRGEPPLHEVHPMRGY